MSTTEERTRTLKARKKEYALLRAIAQEASVASEVRWVVWHPKYRRSYCASSVAYAWLCAGDSQRALFEKPISQADLKQRGWRCDRVGDGDGR